MSLEAVLIGINIAVPIVVALLALIAPFALIGGIIVALDSKGDPDLAARKKDIRLGIYIAITPLVLLLLVLSLWGLGKVLSQL